MNEQLKSQRVGHVSTDILSTLQVVGFLYYRKYIDDEFMTYNQYLDYFKRLCITKTYKY